MADDIDAQLLQELEEIFVGQTDPASVYADDGLATDEGVLYALAASIEQGLQPGGASLLFGVLSPATTQANGIGEDSEGSTSYSVVELGEVEGNIVGALWGQRFGAEIIAAAVATSGEAGGERAHHSVHLVTRSGREAAVMREDGGELLQILDPRGTDKGAILARCMGTSAVDGLPAWTPAMAVGSWVTAPVLERLGELDTSEEEASARSVHHALHSLRELDATMEGEDVPDIDSTWQIVHSGAENVRSELEELARRFNAHGFAGSAQLSLLPESFGGVDGIQWCGEATVGALLQRHASPVHPVGYAMSSRKHPEATRLVLSMLAHTGLLYAA